MSSLLNDFYENKKAGKSTGGIAIVAKRKMVFPPLVCQNLNILNIEEAITKVDVIVHPKKPLLLIIPNEQGNYRISGTNDHPEIYCAPVCGEILERLKIKINKAGTVRFPVITFNVDESTGKTYALVDLTHMTANDGVYTTLN